MLVFTKIFFFISQGVILHILPLFLTQLDLQEILQSFFICASHLLHLVVIHLHRYVSRHDFCISTGVCFLNNMNFGTEANSALRSKCGQKKLTKLNQTCHLNLQSFAETWYFAYCSAVV